MIGAVRVAVKVFQRAADSRVVGWLGDGLERAELDRRLGVE